MPTTLALSELLALAEKPIEASEILDDLKPPHHFSSASFSNYVPESEYPSQTDALSAISHFVRELENEGKVSLFSLKRLFRSDRSEGKGIYLDGGFGVGKTHLLASAYHSFNGKKAYLSFQELMFLVGLQKLDETARSLKEYKLIVIDEFELDDPANSRISTNLLGQLLDAGVSIITSSNTPPGALGVERFSSEDFARELGELTRRFETIRIDGEDYRTLHHLDDSTKTSWLSHKDALFEIWKKTVKANSKKMVVLDFAELEKILSSAHPMRIRQILRGVDAVVISDFMQFAHPSDALRFVYFTDKCYDNNTRILVGSDLLLEDIFHYSYFSGGDTKKYRRTLSRLKEMTRITAEKLMQLNAPELSPE